MAAAAIAAANPRAVIGHWMEYRDHDRMRMFSRRTALVASAKVLLFGALAGRLYYLQVVKAERYAMLADENRINLRLLAPSRGRIVDRFGIPLAINQENYRVMITSEDTPNVEDTLDRLAQIIRLTQKERARILHEVDLKKNFVPVTVQEFLNWERVAHIEVNAPDLPGVSIEVGQWRFYPNADPASHVLGYVASVAKEDLNGDPLLELPGFRIGKNGIERHYDLALRGRAGTRHLEVNAQGRVIRELDRKEGQRGNELVLTLDMELQRLATERLAEQSGSVVVVDIHTGDVLCLASTPTYNPNAFSSGLTTKYWRQLIDDKRAPLRNKAVAGEYSPGSVFKMTVALAALAEGVIDAETTYNCMGSLRLGDGKFHCWKRGGHGKVSLLRGIRESCDVYFYEVARRVGIDRIAAMGKKLGLSAKLNIDIPGERAGIIPNKNWKRAARGEPWVMGDTLNAGVGQGYVLTTPLQLAIMTARLANGGKAVRPHLARDIIEVDQLVPRAAPAFPSLKLNKHHLSLIQRGMEQVTQHQRGTARHSAIKEKGMEMAGKTGTSQVRRITKHERATGVLKNDELAWNRRDHALFVGFAPISAPRYAIAVVVEHGGVGSSVAAPIAHDVMLECQKRNLSQQSPGTKVTNVPSQLMVAEHGRDN